MPVALVTDTTHYLPRQLVGAKRLHEVSLYVKFQGRQMREAELLDNFDSFYASLRTADEMPTTSQPTPAEFEAAFREAAADGSSVVCTTMSADMSGTHGSALAAREAVADLDVTVIDTRTVAVGHYNIVRAAVARADAGGTRDEVIEAVRDGVRRERAVFTVATLEYLRRGGRIGGGRALLGSVLNIKPILQVSEGHIDAYDKVRTNQRALERIADELISAVGEGGRRAVAVVGHADRLEDAQQLIERVAPHCETDPGLIYIGPIVGCHAGPGCLGLSFHLAN